MGTHISKVYVIDRINAPGTLLTIANVNRKSVTLDTWGKEQVEVGI